MSKKTAITDPFQPKITRNDRFAQMSHQEKVIEQKKKEIQAKLEAKQKTVVTTTPTTTPTTKPTTITKPTPVVKTTKSDLKRFGFNLFNNDGSFLDTFKQIKDRKMDSKLKSFRSKDSYNNEQRGNGNNNNNKNSRWSQRKRSPSPKLAPIKNRVSRFSDRNLFEPKITINTSFSNPAQTMGSFEMSQSQAPLIPISPQNVTGQPLLKNIINPPPTVLFSTPVTQNIQTTAPPVIAAPPLLLNVPPPQILVSTPTVNVTIPASGVLTTVSLPPPPVTVTTPNALPVPPPCVTPVELSSIPPPNPIQVQNIPQPEPINTLNIPHPAPIQVQNIPTPTSIQLNEIPNPKPLDLLQIPTPNEEQKSISDPDFIKNVPPPNKSIPPPSLAESTVNIPPPNTQVQAMVPPPNIIPVSMPPPQQPNLTVPCQNILVHTLPPPQPLQAINVQATTAVPPPNLQISVALPVTVANTAIPSLMAQPILPPPGMTVAAVNVNCPPPMLQGPPPPPSFVNQPPPITTQMPPMNVPPPQTAIINPAPVGQPFREICAVIPPGTPEYEAMASLGRMVAECGPGIEDVVRQRKTQDPNLWFLFHKESPAYRQYQQLVAQFRRDIKPEPVEPDVTDSNKYQPEDIFEPDADDELDMCDLKQEPMRFRDSDYEPSMKRKRKSRWGDKDMSVPPPSVVVPRPGPRPQSSQAVMLSKITRGDPGLAQYAITTYGSTSLTEEEWKKVEDNYKVNLLYQDMIKKREELEKLQKSGKHKYDYDSDEDIEGGTWEHKLRDKEMVATQKWANELTRQAEGKHHIGDFLPPDELKKFMERFGKEGGLTPTPSDYKEFKIKEDNIGFKMLQKLGWSQGQGLGQNGGGIVEPVNKAPARDQNQGLGLCENSEEKEDEYDAYRKRMMLAYRFRPNPLNNPRRPYY